jgi:uncharacterized protein YecT (DUF1311 family)
MLSVIVASWAFGTAQMPEFTPPRPAVECSEHLTDWPARRSCLRGLLDEAETALDAAVDAARAEAEESDLDTAGHFHAVARLEAAQSAWLAYRDAECDRRTALMFIGEDSREEIGLDCRISLTRARTTELREM